MSEKLDLIKKILARCKRKDERLTLPLIMSHCLPPSSKWSPPVMIDNISGGGLKFHSAKRLKSGAKFNAKIDLPNKLQPISINGKIIWCEKINSKKDPKKPLYNIGVEFLKINNQDRHKFVSYLCEEILFQYLTNEGKMKPKWI